MLCLFKLLAIKTLLEANLDNISPSKLQIKEKILSTSTELKQNSFI